MTKIWALVLVSTAILLATAAYASKEKVWGKEGVVCVWTQVCGQGSGGGSVSSPADTGCTFPATFPCTF